MKAAGERSADSKPEGKSTEEKSTDEKSTERGEVEDDPALRLDWQVHASGVHSPESKSRFLQQRAAHGTLVERRDRGPAALVDLKTAKFPAERQQESSSASAPAWISVGPADAEYEQNGGFSGLVRDSGRARKILPHPTDPNTVYFLTSGGGLWVTNNFLTDPPTWKPLTDNLPTTGGGGVAFGRTPDVLYLGLGDPFDVINVGGAMVKSTDGGQTWSNFVELGAAQSVRDVKVDSSGPEDVVLVTTDVGLFRSVDSGVTYVPILGGNGELFQGKAMWHMVLSSAGYLVEAQACPQIPATFCGQPGVIYLSTDIGATWMPITNANNGFSGAGRATLAVAQPGDAVVYAIAATVADSDQFDLFQSTDGGVTWVALHINAIVPTNPNANNTNMDILHNQAWYNQLILVDPRDALRKTVYIGGNLSSAKTTDGGVTWTLISDWLYGGRGPSYAHADFHTAAFSDVGGTPRLLFGSDGGLFVSTDDGVTWSSRKNVGLETFLLYTVMGTPKYPNAAIAGAQDNGTRVRKGNSKVFNQSIGGDGLGVGWSQANGAAALGTAAGSAYRRSTLDKIPDRIEDWESFSLPALTGDGTVFATPIETPPAAADPTGTTFYTFSSKRAFKLTNSARSVVALGTMGQNGLPALTARSFRGDVHNLGVSPDLKHIAVNANGGAIEITSDEGASWTERQLVSLVPGWVGFNSSVRWVGDQILYVTSEAPTSGVARIAKSSDGGGTWVRADTGIPDGRVNRVIADPRDSTGNTLYAASDLGVFRSTDGAANWLPYGNGLPNVRVSDIYMPPDGSYLIAATYGRGLWELPAISYAGSTLTDDGMACHPDGILDAGETGHLNIILHNSGNGTFNGITATVTSTNPNITFPDGNSVSFPSAGPNGDTTASVAVTLSAQTTGIQQADFAIAFTDSSLSLPSAVTAHVSFRANYDEVPNSSVSDKFEANDSLWSVAGTPTAFPDTYQWERREIGPVEHRWANTNSNVIADQSLVSPVMHVAPNVPFVISFEQRYFFEFSGTQFYDGMVLEISTGSGGWTDIGQSASPTYDHLLFAPNDNPLAGKMAYSGRSATYPAFVPVTVNLDTNYAGQDVQIRFRVVTDSGGFGTGVEVRNVATTGLTSPPFTAVIPHVAVCASTTQTKANENPSSFGRTVALTASVSGQGNVPTGTVTFQEGTVMLGAQTLVGGQGVFSIASLNAGTHVINTAYSGDGSFVPSTSSITLMVSPAATTTAVSALSPVAFGIPVTLTATVASPGGTPGGQITFFDGATSLGVGNLNAGGSASISVSTFAVGTHAITAAYGGNGNYTTSTSAAVNQVIGSPSFTVGGTTLAATVKAGLSTSLSLTVTANGTLPAPITFSCSGLPMGASCTFSPSSVPPGAGSTNVALTLATTGSGGTMALLNSRHGMSFAFVLSFAPLPAVILIGLGRRRYRGKLWSSISLGAAGLALIVLSSCGGGAKPPTATNATPAGAYIVGVVSTSGSVQNVTVVNLTVQ